MSRLAFGVRRLAFRHQHRHFYSNEDSLRDESSAMLAIANPEQMRPPRSAQTEWRMMGWPYRTERQTPNPERSRPYFTSFKRSA